MSKVPEEKETSQMNTENENSGFYFFCKVTKEGLLIKSSKSNERKEVLLLKLENKKKRNNKSTRKQHAPFWLKESDSSLKVLRKGEQGVYSEIWEKDIYSKISDLLKRNRQKFKEITGYSIDDIVHSSPYDDIYDSEDIEMFSDENSLNFEKGEEKKLEYIVYNILQLRLEKEKEKELERMRNGINVDSKGSLKKKYKKKTNGVIQEKENNELHEEGNEKNEDVEKWNEYKPEKEKKEQKVKTLKEERNEEIHEMMKTELQGHERNVTNPVLKEDDTGEATEVEISQLIQEEEDKQSTYSVTSAEAENIEYEDNKIYPKIYSYEPTNFEKFKEHIKNENELRHYECYESTMNEHYDRTNENYYEEILKNENIRKFVGELWENRSNLGTEEEYNEFCKQLRKKYKVSPSKHSISVALQHYHLQKEKERGEKQNSEDASTAISEEEMKKKKEQEKEEWIEGDNVHNENGGISRNVSFEEQNRENDKEKKDKERKDKEGKDKQEEFFVKEKEIELGKRKDVKSTLEDVNKMIISKEVTNYKDLDKASVNLLQINKRKSVRSNSGVLVITIITHPHKFSCKYDCYYCPNEPNQPRSYLSTEPAILRANQNNFDVICQFFNRTATLVNNGHIPDKFEILVLGGTWSCYSLEYQQEFIRDIYYAANIYPVLNNRREKYSLEKEQEINETSTCRIIGLTLETRPDQINKAELLRLRRYGCTRVQLGIQHTDNFILKQVNRQCTLEDCINAIYLLKENGFKVDIHLMPDLPYTTVQKDLEMFQYVLSTIYLQADQWKIYPCEVTPFTRIEKWYNESTYIPYFEKDKNLLIYLIFLVKKSVHPWIRLNRVIRDIPNPSIIAGNNITNMRQVVYNEMNIRNVHCQCIRCKEVKDIKLEKGKRSIFLKIYKYETLGGDEYFISFQGKKRKRDIKKGKGRKKEKRERKRKDKGEEKGEKDDIVKDIVNDIINENKVNIVEEEKNKKLSNEKYEEIRKENGTYDQGENLINDISYLEKEAQNIVFPNKAISINEGKKETEAVKDSIHTTKSVSPLNEIDNKNASKDTNNISEKDFDIPDTEFDDYDTDHVLLGFLRLRLRRDNSYGDDRPFKCLENAALIRELHVYGSLLKHDDYKDEMDFIQHRGLGKCLVLVAEIISFFHNYRKMAIIAGVGTREYYKKLGYEKEETFVTKILKREDIYESYLLHYDKIGNTLYINNYNIKYSLHLMQKTIPEPCKYWKTEMDDLNSYIQEHIMSLNSSDDLSKSQKCTISEINIKRLLSQKKNVFNVVVDFVKKLIQIRFLQPYVQFKSQILVTRRPIFYYGVSSVFLLTCFLFSSIRFMKTRRKMLEL